MKSLDNIPICTSRTPSSSITAPVADHSSDVDYTVQPPSRPPSFASTPESRSLNLEPTLLCPYPLSTRNASLSSNDIPRAGLLSEHERRRSTSHINRYPVRPSSRASSRIHTHHGTGIYTVRSSVDLPRELGLSQVEIVAGDSAEKVNRGEERTPIQEGKCVRRHMNPTMVVERYNRNIFLPKQGSDYKYVISRLTTSFPREGIPSGWTACVHPEGALYFYQASQRIYTDANIRDPSVLVEIESFANALEEHAKEESISIPPGSELVLELEREGTHDYTWSYYFVDIESKSLFWLHDFDVTWWISELVGETSLSHIKLEIERYFWMHMEFFPHGHEITESVLYDLTGELIHALGDRLTSPVSTTGFTMKHLNKMLEITKEIQAHGSSDYSVCILGRFYNMLAHPRFLNYYGEYGARLCSDQSVHGQSSARTFTSWCLSPILFNAHHWQRKKLEKIWIDMTVHQESWAHFVENIKTEWQQITISSSITLIITVVFLCVLGVRNRSTSRNPAETLSYISGALSAGSVVLGMLLGRRYGDRPMETVEEAAKFLYSKSRIFGGIEALAILYGLPYALMIWGILIFLAAFSFECFVTRDPVALYVSGASWILIALFIMWCLWEVWALDEDSFFRNASSEIRRIFQTLIARNPSETTVTETMSYSRQSELSIHRNPV